MRTIFLLIAAAALLVSCSQQRNTPQEPLTYVSLGDSLAVGVGASEPEERGYAPLYRKHLQEATGREVRLVQLGVSGETSESFIGGYPNEESSQLARAEEALRENPGAVVTLSIGGNDLLSVADATDAERAAAISDYEENLKFILRTLRTASEPAPRVTVLALYNPAPGSFTDRWTRELNAEIRRAANENGARVADGYAAFRGHEGRYTHFDARSWDIHPTDAGYQALARAFARGDAIG